MIIYFVNKLSSITSPFDITDANRNKIIKVGDVCIREDVNGLSFLLVTSETSNWNACKRVGYVSGKLNLEGNTLLFSFDGLSERQGRLDICMSLCELYQDDPLHSFFTNAVDILLYKCDLWDISIFSQMLAHSPIESVPIIQNSRAKSETHTTLFELYLPKESKILFDTMFSEGAATREIYIKIRSTYPDDFRKALKKFMFDNPGASIYDK